MSPIDKIMGESKHKDAAVPVSTKSLGSFVITTRTIPSRRAHLPTRAVAVSSRWSRPRLIVETECGKSLITAAFHSEVPDAVELCDDCALADFTPAVVYRLFDRDGTLLYVGCTKDLAMRLRGHLFGEDPKPWRSRIDHWTYEPHVSYEAALAAEARAIVVEEPLFNVDLTERAPHPRRRRSANLHLAGAA